ncbi:hypothetical protein CDL15_Pgr007691 [Punica granatum]|uniref:Uncharacterized protein n=1 Tax=Punica granatum TaxID=22663 RepID=A0A218X9P5_PUNGR|nr:hypothetical protein CDL15_Pgr007691 [Punica granatum]
MPPFDYTPPPYTGPSAAEILAKRKEFLSCSMFHFNKKPLNLVHGKMQYLFDEDGRRYLNAFGGIATVSCGHCQPDVVNAVVTQTDRLQHSTILYLNHAIADFTQGPSLEAAWRTQRLREWDTDWGSSDRSPDCRSPDPTQLLQYLWREPRVHRGRACCPTSDRERKPPRKLARHRFSS